MRNFNFYVAVAARSTNCCTFFIVDAGGSDMIISSILMSGAG
jgi:hypothetical protein